MLFLRLFILFLIGFLFNTFDVNAAFLGASLIKCGDSANPQGSQAICDTAPTRSGTICTPIQSVLDANGSVQYTTSATSTSTSISSAAYTMFAICAENDREYCVLDSDCVVVGRPDCLDNAYSYKRFVPTADTFGVCGVANATSENNAIAQAICKAIKVVTGSAGRAVVVVVIISTGIMFFVGKVSWNMIIAVVIGAATIFGAPSLVKLVAGKTLRC